MFKTYIKIIPRYVPTASLQKKSRFERAQLCRTAEKMHAFIIIFCAKLLNLKKGCFVYLVNRELERNDG